MEVGRQGKSCEFSSTSFSLLSLDLDLDLWSLSSSSSSLSRRAHAAEIMQRYHRSTCWGGREQQASMRAALSERERGLKRTREFLFNLLLHFFISHRGRRCLVFVSSRSKANISIQLVCGGGGISSLEKKKQKKITVVLLFTYLKRGMSARARGPTRRHPVLASSCSLV